jgi:hypothetical protein
MKCRACDEAEGDRTGYCEGCAKKIDRDLAIHDARAVRLEMQRRGHPTTDISDYIEQLQGEV